MLNLSTFQGGALSGHCLVRKGRRVELPRRRRKRRGHKWFQTSFYFHKSLDMIRFDDYFQQGCNYQMVAILFLRSMKYDDLILRGTSNKFVTCASEYCGSFTFEAMHFGCPSHPLCKILKNQP